MKLILPLLATALVGVGETPAAAPAPRASGVELARPNPDSCQSAIRQVREGNGLPALDRGPARPGQGMMIAAVDKRIDDCRVLVMARDHRDIRPEPAPADGKAGLIPAR